MTMRDMFLVTIVALSCGRLESALRVEVKVTPGVRFECVQLDVFEKDNSGVVVRTGISAKTGTETPATESYVFGIPQRKLANKLLLRASARNGACDVPESLKISSQVSEVEFEFVPFSLSDVSLTLLKPTSQQDADQDGYIAAGEGGADCNDSDATIFPSAVQNCSSLEDTNCNGVTACDEASCSAMPFCGNPPERLDIKTVDANVSLLRGSCVPLEIGLFNQVGERKGIRNSLVNVVANAGVSFYRDEACKNELENPLKFGLDVQSLRLSIKLDRVVSAQIEAVDASPISRLTKGQLTLDIQPTAIAAFAWMNVPNQQRAGVCSPAIQVELRDAANNATESIRDESVSLSVTNPTASGNAKFFSSPDCSPTSARSMLTIPAKQNALQVYVRAEKSSVYTLKASGAVVGTSTLEIVPAAPEKIVFAPTSVGLTANICSPTSYLAKIFDAFDNLAKEDAAVSLALSMPNTLSVFTSAGCNQTAVNSLEIPSRASEVPFWLKVAGLGSPLLTATIGGQGNPFVLPITTNAGPATKIVPPMNAAIAPAGTCAPMVFSFRDNNNTQAVFGGTVTMNSSYFPASDLIFSANSNCSNPSGSLAVPAGSTSFTVYFSSQKANPSFEIFAKAPGLIPANRPDNRIVPATADSMAFVGLPSNLVAGVCAGPITLKRVDAFGNETSDPNGTALVLSSALGVSLAAACDAAGQQTVAFNGADSVAVYVRGTVAIPTALSATASFNRPSGGPVSTSTTVTVNPAAANKLVVLSQIPAGNLKSGECTELKVQVQDEFGNPVVGTRTISANPTFNSGATNDIQFGANCPGATSATAAVTLTATESTTSIFAKALRPSVAKIDFSTLLLTGASATVTAIVGDARKLDWKPTPNIFPERYTCVPLSVMVKDFGDTDVPAPANFTLILSATPAVARVAFYSDAQCKNEVTQIALTTGAVSTGFYAAFAKGGSTVVSMGVSGLTPPPSLTFTPSTSMQAPTFSISTPSPDLEAGGCLPLNIRRTKGAGGPPIVFGKSQVSLTLTNGVTLHTDSDCKTAAVSPTTGLEFPTTVGLEDELTYFLRGHSAPTKATLSNVLTSFETADAIDATGFGSGSAVSVYPLVRRGTCNITAGTMMCAASLLDFPSANDISRSFVVTSGSSDSDVPGIAAARCYLNAGPTASVVCERKTPGASALALHYQVVSWGLPFDRGGVSVQHLRGDFPNNTTTLMLSLAGVVPAQSFVLLSHEQTGMTLGFDDFASAALTAVDKVTLTRISAGNSMAYSIQVVQFADSEVQRGDAKILAADNSLTASPVASTRPSFPLISTSYKDSSTMSPACRRLVRGALDANGMLTFNRGCSGVDSYVQWEKVGLPLNSVVRNVGDIGISPSSTSPVTPAAFGVVDAHRSISLAASQGMNGQSIGETPRSTALGGVYSLGFGTATLSLPPNTPTATQVLITRASSNSAAESSAIFSPFVIQFAP
jgi:hypothetical protein